LAKLHFITSNEGKFKEVAEKAAPYGYQLVKAKVDYPEVQADTLDEVALFGMDFLKDIVPGDFLLEDSGLFIEPLGGFPGVYSAYVYKTIGNKGILRLLGNRPDRKAMFRSCFGYYTNFRGPLVVSAECKGTISLEERGSRGFGYDPIFIPDGDERTFAEMSLEEKNAMSHRAKALTALLKVMKGR
jgi:XTP/dITP diphosphohydrolase